MFRELFYSQMALQLNIAIYITVILNTIIILNVVCWTLV